jgi:hypothetical protein
MFWFFLSPIQSGVCRPGCFTEEPVCVEMSYQDGSTPRGFWKSAGLILVITVGEDIPGFGI